MSCRLLCRQWFAPWPVLCHAIAFWEWIVQAIFPHHACDTQTMNWVVLHGRICMNFGLLGLEFRIDELKVSIKCLFFSVGFVSLVWIIWNLDNFAKGVYVGVACMRFYGPSLHTHTMHAYSRGSNKPDNMSIGMHSQGNRSFPYVTWFNSKNLEKVPQFCSYVCNIFFLLLSFNGEFTKLASPENILFAKGASTAKRISGNSSKGVRFSERGNCMQMRIRHLLGNVNALKALTYKRQRCRCIGRYIGREISHLSWFFFVSEKHVKLSRLSN